MDQQIDLFTELYPKKVINKPIRLITLFSGIGAQEKALEVLGVPFESYKTCEWAYNSIRSFHAIHFPNDTKDYSLGKSKEEMINRIRGISVNYNEPLSDEQLNKKNIEWIKSAYNSCEAIHNLVNIMNVKGKDLEIVDKDKYEYVLTYSFPCLTKDSLILTENGYKQFKDLRIGEKVLTKSNTWHSIDKIFDNGIHNTGYLNAMGFENIHCTPNHKFYIREMYRKGHKNIRCFKEPNFKEAQQLTKKDYLGIPVIKEEKSFYTDDVKFWYMIGMYLGDGWISKQGNSIIFGFNKSKMYKFKQHCDYRFTFWKSGNNYRVRFANKKIRDFIYKYIGSGSETKRIPIEILKLPTKQLQAFYNGYLDTDGCVIGNKHQFSTINRQLAYSLLSIIHKLFHRPACLYKIKVKPKKKIENRIVNQKDWYQIRFKLEDNKQDKAFYENGYIWYPFKSFELDKQEHVYNMEINEDHSYIVQGCVSKNCQDLSLAGKRAGMAVSQKEGGTRSGLLWEVERILCELAATDTHTHTHTSLPSVLIMENVPEVIGAGNLEHFNKWELKLEELGYQNYIKILNAKNYGIPQNRRRCFMVSILGDYSYEFPQEIRLKYRLKDLLEKSVDEKYYLSDAKIEQVKAWNCQEKPLEKVKGEEDSISDTLTTHCGKDSGGMRLVAIKENTKDGYRMASEGDGINISSRMHHLVKEGKVKENDIVKHSYTKQILSGNKKAVEKQDEMITLTTRGDCLGVTVKDDSLFTETEKNLFTPDGNIKRYLGSEKVDEFKEGQMATTTYPNGYGHGPRTHDESIALNTIDRPSVKVKCKYCSNCKHCASILWMGFETYKCKLFDKDINNDTEGMANACKDYDPKVEKSNLRIRKLVPLECGKLMAFTRKDVEAMRKVGNSDMQLYHQFGDSICCNVLVGIFGNLFEGIDTTKVINDYIKKEIVEK